MKLYDPLNPQRTWRIDGILYEFAPGIEIPAGGSLLVVANSPTEVCLARSLASNTMTETVSPNDPASDPGAPDETQVVGPYAIRLANGGQSLSLLKPISTTDADGATEDVAYAVVDQVDYDKGWPWPTMAAGNGATLRRVDLNGFGNEPTNWQDLVFVETVLSADALSPHVGLCTFEAFSQADSGEQDEANIEIHWVSHTEVNVAVYRLWRSESGKREDAVQINNEPIAAKGAEGTSSHYEFVDIGGHKQNRSTYWLEAVSESGAVSEVAFTRTRRPISRSFLPIVKR